MNVRAKHCVGTLLASLAVLASTTAEASASRYYPLVEARPIYRRDALVSGSVQFGFQKYVIVSTANLRPTPNPLDIGLAPVDTAMVVKNLQTGQSYFNDDCYGTAKSSCIFVPVSSSQNHLQITVFAARAMYFGVADISVNGALIDEDVEFGGTIINLDVPNRRRPYRFQTVHVPNGANDTQLLLFDANWRERVHNDDSGVGRAASFTAVKRTGDRLLVGSWAAASRGYTSVVINDCVFHPDSDDKDRWECNRAGLDDDKDNLSNALERELRTDPQHHDTDRDGLFDYYEAIGRIVGSSEQELAFYGASPRRRDLFLEYDQECRGTV